MSSYSLKYLFRARFANGEVYDQPLDDRARIQEGKSAFYDVQYRQDLLLSFELRDLAGRFAASVDLIDGHFEYVGGDNFDMTEVGPIRRHEPQYPDQSHGPFCLIYFRRVSWHQGGFAKPPDVEYHLGWKTLCADGRNFQQTISFK